MKNHRRSPRGEGEVLAGIFAASIIVDGTEISTREAYLRSLQNAALRGDVDASIELQKIREECGANAAPTGGYLVVPAEVTLEEFERMAYDQQAPFREKTQPEAGA